MRKIRFELTQTGTEEFVAQSALKIFVEKEEIDSTFMLDILTMACTDFGTRVESVLAYSSGDIYAVRIRTLNGNLLDIKIDLPARISPSQILGKFEENINKLEKFKRVYEKKMYEVHKTTKNYTFKI
ncbi:hypothetical protein [Arcobacter sp. L]|jgi:hypothetical protein|uniref:hypothetical protein n=1 Tax=Arcobacter sp. L TaxID=944547 RepID=UPI0002296470|nr:hypothetical protein [Arcobacter sp. L]BAK73720.1 hypothetical protein ABLL_1845 [Arcobacter sp. L]